MNGQQYTNDGLSFGFYLAPHVYRLSVPGTEGEFNSWLDPKVTLPQAGYVLVRVWGTGFMGGTDYRCLINNATVEDYLEATYDARLDAILCWSNRWVDGTNAVEVTLNGREYTRDGVQLEINLFWSGERRKIARGIVSGPDPEAGAD